jgi:hypothetical protein
LDEIAEAVSNGVTKMNIDTDTQYAFSRLIADTALKKYDGFLKVDGEVGTKKVFGPRSCGKTAETAMAARVVEASRELGALGDAQSWMRISIHNTDYELRRHQGPEIRLPSAQVPGSRLAWAGPTSSLPRRRMRALTRR